jgi:hypothetical protein
MTDLVASTIQRVKAHPLTAAAFLLVTVLVGIAKGGEAIETLSRLWHKWATSKPIFDTTWQGVWEKPDGHTFSFVMKLAVPANDSTSGLILWRLVNTPALSHLQPRIGDEAIEFVSGTYDRMAHVLEVAGDSVTDESLLATDSYKFKVLQDSISFVAMTQTNEGRWDASANGRVIIVPRRR